MRVAIHLGAVLGSILGNVVAEDTLGSVRGERFTLRQQVTPKRISESSGNTITTNVINLERRNDSASQSSLYLNAIRAGSDSDGVYSRVETTGNASILAVQGGSVFLAPITVGAQSFSVVIDTGSSDTWLVGSTYTCANPSTQATVAASACKFGPSYTLSSTAHQIANENFNISYADGELLNGLMYHENVTLASISVSQQELAIVDYAAWNGDTISSGLVGLAYPLLTNAYSGTDPKSDTSDDYENYNPIFTTIYTENLTAPVFSLALQRASNTALSANGGVLALGGVPNIIHGPVFYSAPIAVTGVDGATGANEYQFYTIDITGWAVSSNASVIFDVQNTTNPRYTPLLPAGGSVIVDSGTTLLYVPDDVAAAVAAAFSPAGTLDSASGLYFVDCEAKAPRFGPVIDKKVFFVNAVDMVLQDGSQCLMGVQAQAGGLNILGDVWMRNVVVVFDIGAAEVRVAAREYTEAKV